MSRKGPEVGQGILDFVEDLNVVHERTKYVDGIKGSPSILIERVIIK